MGKATIIEAQNSSTVYEEGKSKGTLGVLKGVFADYQNGTRNSGRLYSEDLWDKRVFGSEDVMEALETKTLFGELDHPEGDRCETLAQNAAITIVKLEKKPEEGVIYGEAEILDTPTGRIVKALADSGAKLGISSRGMGEEIYYEGQNIIDPETYDFITFDVVVTPANTKARVQLSESKHINKLTESLKKEINESETANQLNQIKTVLESVAVNDKTELVNLAETKLAKITAPKLNTVKLDEANKTIALNLLRRKFQETVTLLNESQKSSDAFATENKVLVESNEFLKSSRDTLKAKLKESTKLNEELSIKLEEAKTESKNMLDNVKKVNERRINHINTVNNDKINSLTENKANLETEYNKLKENYAKLEETNTKLNKKLEESSKILIENINLKKQVENLEKEKQSVNTKLTESKLQESNQIKALENKIKQLESNNNRLSEAQDRFSKLAFNPLGTVKAVTENFGQTNMSEEDMELFNALTNK